MIKRVCLFLGIILVQISAPQGGYAVIFNPKEFTLANGMRCIVIENNAVSAVFHSLWIKVGGSDEKPGKSGKAHFLEHMMFRGTENHGPGEFDAILHRIGGKNNAFTTQDTTVYHETVPKEHLETAMRLGADRLTGLKITDDVFLPEKQVILEERNMRVDNEPVGALYEQLFAELFIQHPYRIPVIGWKEEIKDLSREDLMAFYKQYYQPNNTLLIVSGGVTVEQVKMLAEKYYGPLKAADIKRQPRLKEPPAIVSKRIALEHSQVRQPRFMRIYRMSQAAEQRAIKVTSAEIMAEILGGGQTSLLYDNLVVKEKLAIALDVNFTSMYRDYATFIISAIPAPGVDLPKLEAGIDRLLAGFLEKGVEEKLLIHVKKKLEAESIYARDSVNKGAEVIGHCLASGGEIDEVENWTAHLESVTKESLLSVAKEILGQTNLVTGYLTPKAA